MAGAIRVAGVPTLFDRLLTADGSGLIRDCWGTAPHFTYGDVLHLSHVTDVAGAGTVLLAADFIADDGTDPDGSEDLNECKPSRIVVEFGGVTHCEYLGAFANHPANSITLAPVFTDTPPGMMTVQVLDTFYIACKYMRVVSCDILRVGARETPKIHLI